MGTLPEEGMRCPLLLPLAPSFQFSTEVGLGDPVQGTLGLVLDQWCDMGLRVLISREDVLSRLRQKRMACAKHLAHEAPNEQASHRDSRMSWCMGEQVHTPVSFHLSTPWSLFPMLQMRVLP